MPLFASPLFWPAPGNRDGYYPDDAKNMSFLHYSSNAAPAESQCPYNWGSEPPAEPKPKPLLIHRCQKLKPLS